LFPLPAPADNPGIASAMPIVLEQTNQPWRMSVVSSPVLLARSVGWRNVRVPR
jgi:hypothetical protein